MKYCDQCGTQLNDTAKLCPTCGNPVTPVFEDTKVPLCKNCGGPIEDGASFCANCGSRIATPAQSEQQAFQGPIPRQDSTISSSKGNSASAQNATPIRVDNKTGKIRNIEKSKKTIRTLGVLACVVIVLIIAFSVLYSYNSPASVAERYVKAYMYQDIVALNKLSAYDYYECLLYWYDGDTEEFFADVSDQYDEDIKNWNQYSKYMKEYVAEELSDLYGDYKITIKATKTKDRALRRIEEELESYILRYEEMTDFDRDDISAVKEVTVKTKLVSEDGIVRNSITVYVVKIGMNWRVLWRSNNDTNIS